MRHGSQIDPPNRFERVHMERDNSDMEWDTEYLNEQIARPIEYIDDESASIVSKNASPDIPFRFSLNPYRGCAHACSYCYARPTHEYLGFNAGLDFETKIVVKRSAPLLFRHFLSNDSWTPEPITFSGVTDCYQPAEREFRLTRQCLEIAVECCQPISIITKNALVVRDLDLLQNLAANNLVHVFFSIATLDADLARDMEPRTSIPVARLRAVEELAASGIPTGVMIAPTVPGLNDEEIPAILQAASSAGATTAGYILLRLPLTVEPVFREWLERTQPNKAERILGRIRETRHGELNNSTWKERMVGSGEIANQIGQMFQLFRKKYGLDGQLPDQRCDLFRSPKSPTGQMKLF